MKSIKVIFISVLIATSLYASQTSKDMPSIVPVEWLKERFSDKNIVILDVRSSEEFKKGHIKGAINTPALWSFFKKETYKIPKLSSLQELFSSAGVEKNSLVILYDAGEFKWAARGYWILKVLGHQNVGLLEHSFGEYVKNHLPISTEAIKPKKSLFVPRVADGEIETKLSTLMAIGKKTIIDGRAYPHYIGKESIAKRFGHIPTSKHRPCTDNIQTLEGGSKMKNIEQLRELYKDLPKNKKIVLYCDGGAEAALNFIVLNELGYDASVYDGSWKEWGNSEQTPIINPQDKKSSP